MKKILILNGPNLNLLGKRQPEIYGYKTMDSVLEAVRKEYAPAEIVYFQSNHEGDIVDRIQQAGFGPEKADGIVLNAAAYTHTSVAIADAVAAVDIPVVEVHISNIFAREDFRHRSMLSGVCRGLIAGFGTEVYSLGVKALLSLEENR